MIPLKDRNPTRRIPVVNISLIVLNVALFLYEARLGPALEPFLYRYGMIPRLVSQEAFNGGIRLGILGTLFSSLFLHGGWLHLIGNMLYLWVFGDNVEDKLGRSRYLVFYLVCGLSAGAVHVLVDPLSQVPTIGASGAISGVLGAYLLMFPKARVLTLIPIFIFLQVTELPAYVLLGLWFVLQFFYGMLSLDSQASGLGGVAWWAHIGGFGAGVLLVFPLRKYR